MFFKRLPARVSSDICVPLSILFLRIRQYAYQSDVDMTFFNIIRIICSASFASAYLLACLINLGNPKRVAYGTGPRAKSVTEVDADHALSCHI